MIKSIIASDSVAPNGARLTTFVLTYPRFIHSEFMTHRVFSRNASSSRAIPVKKQIEMVKTNPAIPIAFTKNKAGMQGGEILDAERSDQALTAWLMARDKAVQMADVLADLEVHKQYANRILEPFAHITVVCSATDYDNFFALRCHEAAQPEIHELADQMYALREENEPHQAVEGELHLPFVTQDEKNEVYAGTVTNLGLVKMSVARCARVSYLNHDGTQSTREQDFQLYNRLVGAAPIHASPAEHQAMAMPYDCAEKRSGNLRGWEQYRKTLQNENIVKFT